MRFSNVAAVLALGLGLAHSLAVSPTHPAITRRSPNEELGNGIAPATTYVPDKKEEVQGVQGVQGDNQAWAEACELPPKTRSLSALWERATTGKGKFKGKGNGKCKKSTKGKTQNTQRDTKKSQWKDATKSKGKATMKFKGKDSTKSKGKDATRFKGKDAMKFKGKAAKTPKKSKREDKVEVIE